MNPITLDKLILQINDSIHSQSDLDNNLSITIYNIIVGSYMGEADIKSSNPLIKRNHEFPAFVQNIFYNLESQLAPNMFKLCSYYDNIIIDQHLILIDPMYKNNTDYFGLKELSFPAKEQYEISYNHKSKNYSNVISSIIPYVIDNDVSQEDINNLLENILSFRFNSCNILVNILDCTSILLKELYINNTNPYIYISKPECILCDNNLEYLPLITVDDDTHEIRWLSYTLDSRYILEYDQYIKDIQFIKNSNLQAQIIKTYDFLKHTYKINTVNQILLSIYKLWGQMTITKQYMLDSYQVIVFNDMQFCDFARLWLDTSTNFKEVLILRFDPFYHANIISYINTLIQQYYNKNAQNNILVLDILINETLQYFNQLNEYFPNEIPDLFAEPNLDIRYLLKQYIEMNNISL